MLSIQSSAFLRRVLLLDAGTSGGMGLLLLLFAAPIGTILNLPGNLLIQIGLVLVPFAAFVGYVAWRPAPARGTVWTVIGLNALWVVESVLLLLSGRIEPNALGYAMLIGQAAGVAALAGLQYIGLQRSVAVAG